MALTDTPRLQPPAHSLLRTAQRRKVEPHKPRHGPADRARLRARGHDHRPRLKKHGTAAARPDSGNRHRRPRRSEGGPRRAAHRPLERDDGQDGPRRPRHSHRHRRRHVARTRVARRAARAQNRRNRRAQTKRTSSRRTKPKRCARSSKPSSAYPSRQYPRTTKLAAPPCSPPSSNTRPRTSKPPPHGRPIEPGAKIVLVAPQDIQAPKGRLILPQVQSSATSSTTAAAHSSAPRTDSRNLDAFKEPPALVITDSQVFRAGR